jgi:hypothetical protein
VRSYGLREWLKRSEPDAKRLTRARRHCANAARRASTLLRDPLFERVHALRLRDFDRLFRGAEINMHLSLSTEMIEYSDLLHLHS